MQAMWQAVKAAVKERVPVHSYRMWIEPLEYLHQAENRLVLSSPNGFSRKRVLDHYAALIADEWSRQLGSPCRLAVEVGASTPEKPSAPERDMQISLPEMAIRPHQGRLLRSDFTFDEFVVGGSNDFAYSAALCLASGRKRSQNSLFLMSGTGMGKSHLSQAIGHHILAQRPAEQVYYMTAEDFSNEMVHAFRHDNIDAFKNKYHQGCDVLVLEDVQHLSGKERTQAELSNTLDCMFQQGKKIIFSSCCSPTEIPKISDELRSRLAFGVISTIEAPGFRTRMRILQRKGAAHGCQIPDEVAQFLASELTEDVRQLESGLIGVTARSSLLGLPIDLALAENVIKNIIRIRKAITVDGIKKLVCREYSISERDVVSPSRRQCFTRPRQVAIYLSRKYTDSPLQAIGKSFNRYHATAMHSIGAVERELKSNATLRRQVDILCQKLESGAF